VYQGIEVEAPAPPPAPPDWALDGSSGGTGRAKLISPLGDVKQRDDVGYDLQEYYLRRAADTRAMLDGEAPLVETGHLEGADVVVVAYGTPARYMRAAVRALRDRGRAVGYVRPISLVPFPSTALATAAERAGLVVVYENSTGQMIDDVALSVLGRCPVAFIGGLTTDTSGFGVGPDLDVDVIRRRIEEAAIAAGVWT
jgi:2-oxoglutarate ferredoxin oxidoreductase subunit alpha